MPKEKSQQPPHKPKAAKSVTAHRPPMKTLMAVHDEDRPAASLGHSPWRSIGVVGRRTSAGFQEVGTCFLFQPDVVVTAGHVVADESADYVVAMAFDGHSPTQGVQVLMVKPDPTFDIGVAILPTPASVPTLPVFSGELAIGQPITLAGYGYGYGFRVAGTDPRNPDNFRMTADTRTITGIQENTISHDVNSSIGDSGGPLMVSPELHVAAIHLSDEDGVNHGVILAPHILKAIKTLIQSARESIA